MGSRSATRNEKVDPIITAAHVHTACVCGNLRNKQLSTAGAWLQAGAVHQALCSRRRPNTAPANRILDESHGQHSYRGAVYSAVPFQQGRKPGCVMQQAQLSLVWGSPFVQAAPPTQ